MNAYEAIKINLTGTAKVDLTAARFLAVKRDTDGLIIKAGDGEKALGILQDGVDINEIAGVTVFGVSFCIFGATVAVGEEVQVDANGKIIPLAAGKSIGICEVGGDADAVGCILIK